jgi:glyoxylase-like metal-dependent hydrolase (beta-lactamase superfamily II)
MTGVPRAWLAILAAACTGVSGAAGQDAASSKPSWCEPRTRAVYASLEEVRSPDEWFRVYAAGPGVYAIFEPYQSEEVLSYLVLGTRRALLLDTGLGIGRIDRVARQLAGELPISVLNTHAHPDHVGGNHAFGTILGTRTPFGAERSKGLPHGKVTWIVDPAEICGKKLPRGVDAGTFGSKPFAVSEYVEDGARLDLGGRTLEIIHTPGHSPDSLAVLDRAHHLLFTGDSFYLAPIYLFLPESDPQAYFRSMKRLVKIATDSGVRTVLPGHNDANLPASKLRDLDRAVRLVEAGKVQPRTDGPMLVYEFEGFSFKLRN